MARGPARLALDLAGLQLKYLFHVLRSGEEPAFEKAIRGYTSIATRLARLPGFEETRGEGKALLESVRLCYAEAASAGDGAAFARKALAVLAPWLTRAALEPEPVFDWFGCFRYAYDEAQGHVYLHFRNACCPESPFADPAGRVQELRRLAADIRSRGAAPATIGCDSWLNELPAFQSLFPPEYKASFAVSPPDSKSGYGWWGQFVGRDGQIHRAKAAEFEKTFAFPCRRLTARCAFAALEAHLAAAGARPG